MRAKHCKRSLIHDCPNTATWLILHLVIIGDVMEWRWWQSTNLRLSAAVFPEGREIEIIQYSDGKQARKEKTINWTPGWPSLFNCGYEVWPRKHGKQAVAVGRRRLVAGAGRIPLICWPAAIDGVPEKNTDHPGQTYVIRSKHFNGTCLQKILKTCNIICIQH